MKNEISLIALVVLFSVGCVRSVPVGAWVIKRESYKTDCVDVHDKSPPGSLAMTHYRFMSVGRCVLPLTADNRLANQATCYGPGGKRMDITEGEFVWQSGELHLRGKITKHLADGSDRQCPVEVAITLTQEPERRASYPVATAR